MSFVFLFQDIYSKDLYLCKILTFGIKKQTRMSIVKKSQDAAVELNADNVQWIQISGTEVKGPIPSKIL